MPWDDIARCQHNRDHLRYPSDLTDREWLIIEPFIPPAKPGGRLRTTTNQPLLGDRPCLRIVFTNERCAHLTMPTVAA